MTKKIIITGKHHTPAIELIRLLDTDPATKWEVYYLTTYSPQDSHLIFDLKQNQKIHLINIICGKFNRRSIFDTIVDIPKIIIGFFQSIYYLIKIRPHLTFSFGSFVSVPVVMASWLVGVKIISHEQTITISLATKINQYFSHIICLTFPSTLNSYALPKAKTKITGNLIRKEIYDTSSQHFYKKFTNSKPLIYITGGSQGSEYINNIIVKNLPKLTDFNIIHQTGINKLTSTPTSNYYPVEYVGKSDIGWILNKSEIVIGRSGANTVCELEALQKKTILIPLPFAQQNEQFQNANWLKQQLPESTIIIDQNQFTIENLIESINRLNKIKIHNKPIFKDNSIFLTLIHENT